MSSSSLMRHGSSYEDMSADEALSVLATESSSLRDLKGLFDVPGNDQLISSILRRDANLKEVLDQHEAHLTEYYESYIDAQCAEAESLCALYHDVTECEDKLKSFENQISGFQQRLTDTAEDIVSMQTETLKVKQKLDNRKDVAHRIKEVYDALNECETFCEKLNYARDVDAEYLSNIRQLAKKISFLADNSELEGSAVDNEIRPQLQRTAQRAGDKLFRFLLKKIQGFAEEGTNVSLQQQAVEKQGQYAFSFLHRFNPPIALELMTQYVRTMSDVYTKQLKQPLKDLAETTTFFARPVQPVAGVEAVQWLQHNCDGGSLFGGNLSNRSNAQSVSMSMNRRSQSMSLEQRFDVLKAKVQQKVDGRDALLEAEYQDTLNSLKAVDVSYRLIALNPVYMIDVQRTTCWAARLTNAFMRLVNNTINEARFVSHFFFVMGPSPDDEEELLQQIFERVHQGVISVLRQEGSQLTDPVTLIASLRAIELFKNYISQSCDAIPLLLLGDVFDTAISVFQKRLHSLLSTQQKELSSLNSMKLSPFKHAEAGLPLLQQMQSVDGLQNALGPHEIVRRFALFAGQLDHLNSVRLMGSRVSSAEGRGVFDDGVDRMLADCFGELRKIVSSLARRHASLLAMNVFTINNIAHVIMKQGAVSAADASSTPSSPSRTTSDGGSFVGGAISSGAESRRVPSYVESAEELLRDEVAQFVRELASTSQLNRVFEYAVDVERNLGAQLASTEQEGDDAPVASPPDGVKEDEFLTMVQAFSRGWQEQLNTVYNSVQRYFSGPEPVEVSNNPRRSATPASVAAPVAMAPHAVAPLTADDIAAHSLEVSTLVMRQFLQKLVSVNATLHAVAKAYYRQHSAIQAKLVGSLALSHEAAKYLRRGDDAEQ